MRSNRRGAASGAIIVARAIAVVLGVLLVALAPARPARAASSGNLLYNFDIVARTGDAGVSTIAGATLGSIGIQPSINSFGNAAFQAGLSTGGNGLFVARVGSAVATNINPFFSNNPSRTFSGAVQINRGDLVAARDQVPGAPALNLVRLWDANATDSFTTIARGGSPLDPFDAVLAFPSVNDNNEVVFSALTPAGSEIATPNGLGGFNELPAPIPLLPRIAFNGNVVFRQGTGPLSSILMVPNDLSLGGATTIASPVNGFGSVGRAPSANDDGSIVVFAGDRGNGTGVFASVDTGGGTRQIIKIAGEGIANLSPLNPPDLGLDDARNPLGFTSVAADSRIGIAHQRLGAAGLDGDTFVVAFVATAPAVTQTDFYLSGVQFTGNRGIWTVRVDMFRKNGELRFRLGPPMPVVQVGDVVNGSGPAGGSFGIDELPDLYDPIANVESDDGITPRAIKAGEHWLVFWARSGTTHLIIRAKQTDTCLLRVQRLPQAGTNAPWRTNTYDSSSKNIGAIGCAMTGVAMQTNHLFRENRIDLGMTSLVGTNFDPGTMNAFMIAHHTFDSTSVNTTKTVNAYNTLAQVTARGVTCSYDATTKQTWQFDVPTRTASLNAAKLPAALAAIDGFVCTKRAPVRIGVDIECSTETVGGVTQCKTMKHPDGTPVLDASGNPVATSISPGHYILIAGKVGNRYFLADPGFNSRKILSTAYGNVFETRGIIRDPVDTSFISLFSDGRVELTLTAPDGKRVGFDPDLFGNLEEIPGGAYTHDALDDDVTGTPDNSPTMQGYVPTPAAGTYQLRLTETQAGPYTVTVDVARSDGTAQPQLQITGNAIPGLSRVFQLMVTTTPGGGTTTLALQSIVVPRLAGLTQAQATSLLGTAGLAVGAITAVASSTVPAGQVVSQNPAAGTPVTPASAVAFTISTGSGTITVPNVVGLTQADAQAAIVAAGLTVGTVTTQASGTVPAGKVISQNPTAGASVAAHSAVALVVSSGPPPVTVPDVVGLPQADAQAAIVAAGLTVGTVTTQASGTVPAGKVISQNPAAGASVVAHSAVALVVSSGAAPPTIPNVVGLTQSAAQTALVSAGYVVGTVSAAVSSTLPPGNVLSQSPPASTPAARGTTVNLVISFGAPIVLSNGFTLQRSGLVLNRTTNTYDQTVVITSTSVRLSRLIELSIGSLSPASVALANGDALDPAGRPFLRVALPGGVLLPGQHVSVVLKFADPTRVPFSYQPILNVFPAP